MDAQFQASQTVVKIKEVKNGIIYLKSGGFRKMLIVGGVNFDLKSHEEQLAIISSFQSFLNTLDFPVQFFIHSRKVNINSYLRKMEERKQEEENELLKIQIDEYIQFVKTFVEKNAIISKTFFVVVPFDPVSLSAEKGAKSILNLFSGTKKQGGEQISLEESLQQLEQRVESVTTGLSDIGLRVSQLGDEEVVELFYNLYNPQLIEKKGLEVTHQEK